MLQVCHGCSSGNSSRVTHTANCPNRTVDCPNGCPIPYIRFCDLDNHVSQICPYREVGCKFFQFGCRKVFKFRDGPRHYVDKVSDHLELLRAFATGQAGLEDGYMQLVQRYTALEIEHQALKEKVVLVESRCEQYESSISQLQEAVRSLKIATERQQPFVRKDPWQLQNKDPWYP